MGLVRKEILGKTERKLLEAYLNGERLKGYQTVLWRIRTIGLKAIIVGCERDLRLLHRLARKEQVKVDNWRRFFSDEEIATMTSSEQK